MKLKHLLTPERVRYCQGDFSRKRILEIVSELLCQEIDNADHLDIFEDMIARERLGSTAMGHGIAIPHIRSELTNKPRAVLLHTAQAIDFDAPDQQKVDLIVGLLVPANADEMHLQILAELARVFKEPHFRQNLRACTDDLSLYAAAIEDD